MKPFNRVLNGLPLFLLMFFFYARHFKPRLHDVLLLENGPIEWLQVMFLLLACCVSVYSGLKQFTSRVMSGAFGLFFFICLLEELDWFQQLIEFQTPTAISRYNTQDALNIHNLQGVGRFSRIVILGISLWGVLVPVFRVLRLDALRLPLTPSRADVLYFVPIIAYFSYCIVVDASASCQPRATSSYAPGWVTWNQQELMELFLYFVLSLQCVRFTANALINGGEQHREAMNRLVASNGIIGDTHL